MAGLVNVKVSRETHRLLLSEKGRMMVDGEDVTLDAVIASVLRRKTPGLLKTRNEEMADIRDRLSRLEASARVMR